MTTAEYEAYVAMRSQPYTDDWNYLVVALNEEAGEVAGWHKKFNLRGNVTGKHSHDDLKGELGDLLFYLTRTAKKGGWTLSDIMEHNKAKLDDRVTKGMKQIA